MLRNISVKTGHGKYAVEMLATLTDEGLIVQVLGGERPHVGAVVLSLPRPSMSEPGELRATSTVVPLYGHRDDEVARPVAEQLAVAFGQPVVVVAGIHVDKAKPHEIAMLVENVSHAVADLIKAIREKIDPR